MRLIILIITLVVSAFGAVGYGVYQENSKPVPVPVVERLPERSHHVVFLEVCGVLEGVLLTTDPLIFSGPNQPSDAYTLELIRKALEANRYMVIHHWRGYCPEKPRYAGKPI